MTRRADDPIRRQRGQLDIFRFFRALRTHSILHIAVLPRLTCVVRIRHTLDFLISDSTVRVSNWNKLCTFISFNKTPLPLALNPKPYMRTIFTARTLIPATVPAEAQIQRSNVISVRTSTLFGVPDCLNDARTFLALMPIHQTNGTVASFPPHCFGEERTLLRPPFGRCRRSYTRTVLVRERYHFHHSSRPDDGVGVDALSSTSVKVIQTPSV